MPPSHCQATFALNQVCHSVIVLISQSLRIKCLQGVLNVSLSPLASPSSSPIDIDGALFLDPKSVMVISLPTNPYSGVPITVGGSLSLQGYLFPLYNISFPKFIRTLIGLAKLITAVFYIGRSSSIYRRQSSMSQRKLSSSSLLRIRILRCV